jgi:hypothetical protein
MGNILVREGEMWRYIGGIKNPNGERPQKRDRESGLCGGARERS